MSMSARHRAWFRFVLCPLSFVLALSGCGLSDYAGHMSSEAARARQWDEETKTLGPPITMPVLPKIKVKTKDKDGKEKEEEQDQKWYVFLRLPQGVYDSPTTAPGSTQAQLHGPLAQYAAGNNAFGIQNVYLGVSTDKEFVSSVYSQFPGVGAGKEQAVGVPRSLVLLTTARRQLSPEINVRRAAVEAQSLYSFNFNEHGSVQVAVVFQMEKGNGAKADNAIKDSLGTLGEGEDEAAEFDRVYSKTNRKVKK
jgi:hypothetical protein